MIIELIILAFLIWGVIGFFALWIGFASAHANNQNEKELLKQLQKQQRK
ncbi:MAG: hypothetical protein AABY22_36510 [Nanoarchaeota archaeon]